MLINLFNVKPVVCHILLTLHFDIEIFFDKMIQDVCQILGLLHTVNTLSKIQNCFATLYEQ